MSTPTLSQLIEQSQKLINKIPPFDTPLPLPPKETEQAATNTSYSILSGIQKSHSI